jgi:hypothetical protein
MWKNASFAHWVSTDSVTSATYLKQEGEVEHDVVFDLTKVVTHAEVLWVLDLLVSILVASHVSESVLELGHAVPTELR